MQTKQKNTGLVWFRNNLRVHDNSSLYKATQNHEKIIAVYFFNPKDFSEDRFGFKKTEKYRATFLIETIKDLQLNLNKINTTLLVYFEAPEKKIIELCNEFSIGSIYTQKEWTTEEVEKIPTSSVDGYKK